MCACADTLEVPEPTMSPLESQRLIHHSPSLSLSASFFLSRRPALTSLSPCRPRPRMIWILIVFLQLPANVAMGECNRAITRQSHPVCRGYEGEFVCFNSDRSNLYCGAVPMKRPSKREKKSVYSGLWCRSPLKI